MNQKLPEYLSSTYEMLKCAFPNGLDNEDYFPLLVALYEGMSQKNLATVIAFFMDRDYAIVYNDVLRSQSTDIPDSEMVAAIKERLLPCGYATWVTEV